jgi:carboxyl-terminal processing protease
MLMVPFTPRLVIDATAEGTPTRDPAGVAGWIAAVVCAFTLTGATTFASPGAALVAHEVPATISEWSQQLWKAAQADDLDQVEVLLSAVPRGESGAAERLVERVRQRQAHLVENSAKRSAEADKRRSGLAEHLAAGKIGAALLDAVNIKFLLPREEYVAWLASPQARQLVEAAESAAREADAADDLLLEQEMLFRLKALHDDAGQNEAFAHYDRQLDRVNRRVSLVAEYAPRELHRLRKLAASRSTEADDEEFPEYNELFGNEWREQHRGITPRMLDIALRQAASEHVTEAGWKPLVDGGLEALRLLATTPALSENFPGIADAGTRDAFVAAIDRRRDALAKRAADSVGLSFYRETMREMLAVNQDTLRLPDEVLVQQFGEGATTQLSKDFEDDYSEIIWPERLRRFRQSIDGNFVGVGILIRHNDKRDVMIVNPLEGSPASRAGVRPGDRIAAVDGKPTDGWSLNRAVDSITGPAGKPVTLSLRRDQEDEPIHVSLVRETIKMRSVNGWWKRGLDQRGNPVWDWWMDAQAGIGYVRLTSFNEDSLDDFMDAIRAMKRERPLNGLVLDLRGNPGGLLKSAVGFTNLFVERGPVVSVQDRDGRRIASIDAEPNRAPLAGLPLVVLINSGSASASEIVAGSLQANGAAVVVGERSFGKGSVQTVQPVKDGAAEAAVKVTTQYYVLPPQKGETGGRLVHRRRTSDDWGVNPDLLVKTSPDQFESLTQIRLRADSLDEGERDLMTVDVRPDVEDLLVKGIDPQIEMGLLVLKGRVLRDLEERHLAQAPSDAPGRSRSRAKAN